MAQTDLERLKELIPLMNRYCDEYYNIRIRGVSSEELYQFIIKQPGVRYAYKINSTNVHFDIPKGAR